MLTQNGIDYICQSFGDISLCCVLQGLSWFYTIGDDDYPETGGTAQIVSRLASGLVDSLTMTNPARGIFTQAELNNANGELVTLEDAQEITNHDEPSEDQWCYSAPPPPTCEDYTNQIDCENAGCFWYNNSCHWEWHCTSINNQNDCDRYGCYWYNGSCNEYSADCEDLDNQIDCERNECYWWSDNTCHWEPEPPVECEDYKYQSHCESSGCYWYDNSCHTELQPSEFPWFLVGIAIIVGGITVLLVSRRKK